MPLAAFEFFRLFYPHVRAVLEQSMNLNRGQLALAANSWLPTFGGQLLLKAQQMLLT